MTTRAPASARTLAISRADAPAGPGDDRDAIGQIERLNHRVSPPELTDVLPPVSGSPPATG